MSMIPLHQLYNLPPKVENDGMWQPPTPVAIQSQNQERRKKVIAKLVLNFKQAVLLEMLNYQTYYDPQLGLRLDLTKFWVENWNVIKCWSVSWDDLAEPLADLNKAGWQVIEKVPMALAGNAADAAMTLWLRDAARQAEELPLR